MKQPYLLWTTVLCWLLSFSVHAQQLRDDSLCINLGENPTVSVLDNDQLEPGQDIFLNLLGDNSKCFRFSKDPERLGVLELINPNDPACCGDHVLRYQVEGVEDFATIFVTVKCPKPDCYSVDLESFLQTDPSGGHQDSVDNCVNACENSLANYYASNSFGNSFYWYVSGGSLYSGQGSNSIEVIWGSAGTGQITLQTDIRNYTFCVDILDAPEASFTAPDSVCLGSTVSFNNTTTGASSYYWDFGDGSFSTQVNPNHAYTSPGTYEVILIATADNTDPEGNPLCCCTDTIKQVVTVESLPGPPILCVSTLCAGNSSDYWTTASNCSSYNWTVLDENGDPWPFTGQGSDTISVTWGNGPTGTIILEVDGCDSSYCSAPTEVTIPIISATTTISGPIEVCLGDIETYTVPKWQGTTYDWQVTNGNIISGQGSHSVTVQWTADPGMITVNYQNSFLNGLPGQDADACEGSGSLSILVRPDFAINGPEPAVLCLGDIAYFSTNQAGSFSWSVSAGASINPTGPNSAQVSASMPGNYIVTATSDDPSLFCNEEITYSVTFVELEVATGILGEDQICPGTVYTYSPDGGSTGVINHWIVNNGSPGSATGSYVDVTWGPSGPYSIGLYQQMSSAPYCLSDTVWLEVSARELNGPLSFVLNNGCINGLESYSLSPAQHPDASYFWQLSPATAGSIIAGQGSSSIDIQWNNDPGNALLKATVYLCGDSLVVQDTITLIPPIEPVITQTGKLCPGDSVSLCVNTPGIVAWDWSTGATTQCIYPSTAGIYAVTTTDSNGCQKTVAYTLDDFPSPVASISSPDDKEICINNADPNETVDIVAQTNPNYTFAWYLYPGTAQPTPSPDPAIFTHDELGVAGAYGYYVVVTDTSTGCMSTSNLLTVLELNCEPDTLCEPQNFSTSINAVNQSPACNTVDFAAFTSNATPYAWYFGDGYTAGGTSSTQHTYTTAGYFDVDLVVQVPGTTPGDTCLISQDTSVCIPLAADFDFAIDCYDVDFSDFSTFLPGQDITSWSWTFGDSNGSSSPSPSHTYSSSGSYTVTLTVANAGGCQAVISKTVTVIGVQNFGLSLSAGPYCAGKAINFYGSGTDILSWLWDYDDGATNGAQNNSHAYENGGTYTVSLTAENYGGCTQTIDTTIVVAPGPPKDTITYSPSLSICEGESVTLTAPSGPGYSWLWNTGASTQSITVSTAGDYEVTVSDADSCSYTTPAVSVTVRPQPDAIISGNPVICDNGCTSLLAGYQSGYTYQWYDASGNPIPGQTSSSIVICTGSILNSYYVEITSTNGCTATSDVVEVVNKPSPNFNLFVDPDYCEGTLSTIKVDPVQANVVYTWNNGASGPSIATAAAGSYTVTGTDTTTGCTHSATAIIHPAPDLCIVPTGCYEICNPDTLSAPAGLDFYQWYVDGFPISGANSNTLIVTQPGSYSLSAVNEFGCESTSDELLLEVLNCDSAGICDSLSVSYMTLVDADGNEHLCCGTFSYTNNSAVPILGLQIHTNDADLDIDLSSIDPALLNYGSGSNYINLVSSASPALSTPIPSGTLTDFIALCMSNPTVPVQEVIIDWYDFDQQIVCSDTLTFYCPVEPPCLYTASDSTWCKGSDVVYEVTICNPAGNTFPINYVEFESNGAPGLSPSQLVLASPLQPGSCITLQLGIDASLTAGDTVCYTLIGHDQDPAESDTANCCSLQEQYCFVVPDCDPCDEVSATITPTDPDNCCYTITLDNGYEDQYFTGVNIQILSPSTTMNLNNFFGSGWTTVINDPTFVELAYSGGYLPLGSSSLPQICIDTEIAPDQYIEVQWLSADSVICRDTLAVSCEPPCGYVREEGFFCDASNGETYYTFSIVNTSGFTMDEAHILFDNPALNGSNQTIALGGLAPGASFGPVTISLGTGITGLECFSVALHELGHEDGHINCCTFRHCMEIPPCDGGEDCLCDDEFTAAAFSGFSTSQSGLTVTVTPNGSAQFDANCDSLFYDWGDGTNSTGNIPGGTEHTYASTGVYEVCAYIARLATDGTFCEYEFCEPIQVTDDAAAGNAAAPVLYPSPSEGRFSIKLDEKVSGRIRIGLINAQGHQRIIATQDADDGTITIDLSTLPKGVYMIFIESKDAQWVQPISIE